MDGKALIAMRKLVTQKDELDAAASTDFQSFREQVLADSAQVVTVLASQESAYFEGSYTHSSTFQVAGFASANSKPSANGVGQSAYGRNGEQNKKQGAAPPGFRVFRHKENVPNALDEIALGGKPRREARRSTSIPEAIGKPNCTGCPSPAPGPSKRPTIEQKT
jgi:hypothetical protein